MQNELERTGNQWSLQGLILEKIAKKGTVDIFKSALKLKEFTVVDIVRDTEISRHTASVIIKIMRDTGMMKTARYEMVRSSKTPVYRITFKNIVFSVDGKEERIG